MVFSECFGEKSRFKFNGFGGSKLKKKRCTSKRSNMDIPHSFRVKRKQNNMKSNVDGNHGLVTVEVEPKAVHHLAISPRFHKN